MDEIAALELRLKRAEQKLLLLTGIGIAVAVILIGGAWLRSLVASTMQPSVGWNDGLIHIFTFDGTNTFTHLAAETNGGRIYAALNPPVVQFESGSFDFDPTKLTWVNERREPAKPPRPGDKVTAIYFRGERVLRQR